MVTFFYVGGLLGEWSNGPTNDKHATMLGPLTSPQAAQRSRLPNPLTLFIHGADMNLAMRLLWLLSSDQSGDEFPRHVISPS